MRLTISPLPTVGQGRVDCDAVQPGWKGGLAAERVELANDLEEHVLRNVLGVGVVAKHPAGKVVNAGGVLAEDPFRGQRRLLGVWRVCHEYPLRRRSRLLPSGYAVVRREGRGLWHGLPACAPPGTGREP